MLTDQLIIIFFIQDKQMEVESLKIENPDFLLPGQSLNSEQKLQYNQNCFYQNKNNQLAVLKYGQPIVKEIKVQNAKNTQATTEKAQYQELINFSHIYQPQKGDLIIGVVKMKSADYYVLDINSSLDAVLGALEFDGATKRNKPNIVQGSLVYCRVTEHSKFLGSKLSCMNKGFSTKNQMGQLKGGIKIFVPKFKHQIIEKKLEFIAKYLKFQIAFGKNGVVWFKTQSNTHMIVLYNVLSQLVSGADDQIITKILETSKN